MSPPLRLALTNMILGMSTASACHLSLSSREADWRQHINCPLQSDTLPQHPVWMVAVKCCRCPCRWSSHAGAYPTTGSHISHDPATTVPCERLFSVSGNIVSKKRASLSPGNVSKMAERLRHNSDLQGLCLLSNFALLNCCEACCL